MRACALPSGVERSYEPDDTVSTFVPVDSKQVNEVLEFARVPGEPVRRVSHDNIDSTGTDRLLQFQPCWPWCAFVCTAVVVGVFPYELPTPLLNELRTQVMLPPDPFRFAGRSLLIRRYIAARIGRQEPP